MSDYSRLDDRYIDDPVIRSFMHNEVVAKSTSQDSDLYGYDIKPEEEYRPDLVAHRVWGTDELRWAVRTIAGTEAEWDPLPVGETLYMPPLAWLRDRIRHFANDGEVSDTVDTD
ncbi:baseplate protein [Pantoea sp. LMR881]|uniref:baseplate protein n=1 Tax=Pantoea sp. LMR881 TaxID=3014336 RepID=UPI0022AEEFAA|nr:baseplate protein [Pantoea sp. LMR881]MCZ4061173.1 baseplate protein [Pantoea sp. LMR881]MCZ4061285.1 baseplate protein [Pantoea sp. LMR881]